ncbi:glycoside hydrolase family 140 protein [Neolewinella lacunae]|uniref:Glycoside hydrolase family 140 protein n=1 Tax=Neolewinella lacunae TaxID=1517758 RepID=A0A923PQ95_9BACT|nr:glycoside hydrolase family 140 protein [Neolewinella lacunae]MBC6994762.1 glycoside hydrolase family 140 protein [Neolewinella lacunae]MDN3634384.1 glycoside hydrolase family 140 protein [Neolewinella lacunae]
MRKKILALLFLLTLALGLSAQSLVVSPNGRFLAKADGSPFFWLADTAWELFHRCDRSEVDLYLEKRAAQEFNVVQAVILAELDGLNEPNPYGEKPLINNDPRTPNEGYFAHVDYTIEKAATLGITMALLPTWGDKLYKDRWGEGPEVLNPENARAFGKWLGARYAKYPNIVWIIGGDRNPRAGSQDEAVWNALAEGIAQAAGGYAKTMMSYHPQPKENGGSSTWFHHQEWLDFNMHQTGHCANQGTYQHITHDYQLQPTKPVLDGEPLYEDHPNCFNAKELGHSIPQDIRRIMYWNVFAGACGQTYGCHDVWQMYKPGRTPINQPLRPWPQALDLPMANQVKHLKNLLLSRPFFTRIPAAAMIVDAQPDDHNHVMATRDSEGSFAMIYFPTGKATNIDFSSLASSKLNSWWFDPRTGNAYPGPNLKRAPRLYITPPTAGAGQDWVLVVDDARRRFVAPGKMP